VILIGGNSLCNTLQELFKIQAKRLESAVLQRTSNEVVGKYPSIEIIKL